MGILVDIGLFLISSLLSFGLIYFNTAHLVNQQILSGVLFISVVLLTRVSKATNTMSRLQKNAAVLLSSFLVQMLIVSSGGFYSPLLIVMHIYTLGAIFLLNNKAPIAFLIFSLAVLGGQIKYDANLASIFQNDPWTAVIYALSFLIIIPLALYLSHSYFVKDAFAKILRNYIQMQEKKETSILTALNDLVVVTDPTLAIISVNIAVETLLHIDSSEIIGQPFFTVFNFKDAQGEKGGIDNLSINQAMADKASRFVEGFMLETKNLTAPKPVLIQVRPLADPQGKVTQIVFVMSDPRPRRDSQTQVHSSVAQALKRKDNLMETFRHLPPTTPYSQIQSKLALITHIEEDVLVMQEVEDHPVKENPQLVDLIVLLKATLTKKQPLAEFLAVGSSLTYDDPEGNEMAYLQLHQDKLMTDLSPTPFSAPLDPKFVGLILEKVLDLGMFVASGLRDRVVTTNATVGSDKIIYVTITFPNPGLTEEEIADFFELDNPKIAQKTHLNFGSGLEGFIAKHLATLLNMPVKLELVQNKAKIAFEIVISKTPRMV